MTSAVDSFIVKYADSVLKSMAYVSAPESGSVQRASSVPTTVLAYNDKSSITLAVRSQMLISKL